MSKAILEEMARKVRTARVHEDRDAVSKAIGEPLKRLLLAELNNEDAETRELVAQALERLSGDDIATAMLDRLLIERLRIAGERVRFAGLALTFGADDVLDPGERKEVAELGGVKDIVGGDDERFARLLVEECDGADAVAVGLDRDGFVPEENLDPAGTPVRGKHFFENGEPDAGFVADRTDWPLAGIEVGIIAGGREEGSGGAGE